MIKATTEKLHYCWIKADYGWGKVEISFRTLKECITYMKKAKNGFFTVITRNGVIHCYTKSGFNLWELNGEYVTLK